MLSSLKFHLLNAVSSKEKADKRRAKREADKAYKKKAIVSDVLLTEESLNSYYNLSYLIAITYFVTYIYNQNSRYFLNNLSSLISKENQKYLLTESLYITLNSEKNSNSPASIQSALNRNFYLNQNDILSFIVKLISPENYANFVTFFRAYQLLLEEHILENKNKKYISIETAHQPKNIKLYVETFKNILNYHEEHIGKLFQNKEHFYNEFNVELKKIAASHCYGDRFKYHVQLSPAEIFNITANTIVDLLMIGVAVALPPVGAAGYATSVAIHAASAASTAGGIAAGSIGARLGAVIYEKAKLILKNDSYKARKLRIPDELLTLLSQEEQNYYTQLGYTTPKVTAIEKSNLPIFYNSYDRELNELYNLQKVVSDISYSIKKNGAINFNITTLFTYYINLIEEVEKLENKNEKKHNLKEHYFKLMNYYRYTALLKQPLHIQLETTKLTLIKSVALLFNPESAFADYSRLNIFNNPNNKKVIKNKIKKILKNEDKAVIDNFTELIFDSLTRGELNQKQTKEYLRQLSLNTGISGELKNVLLPKGNSPDDLFTKSGTITTKVLGNLYFKNIQTPYGELTPSLQTTGINLSISAGGSLIYLLVSTLISDYASYQLKNRFVDICQVLNGGYTALCAVQGTMGTIKIANNFANFITDPVANSIVTNVGLFPLKIVASFGISYLSYKIDQHEKKFWDKIVNNYIEQQNNQNKDPNTLNKSSRPAYDYYKEVRNHFPTRYMKAITDLQDKRLQNINELTTKINANLLSLMSKCQKYNNKNNPQNFESYMPKSEFDDYNKYELYNEKLSDEIIEKYTKIVLNMILLAKEIQSYEDYLKYFVDGFLSEVDNSLHLYMLLLKIDNSKVSEVIKFAQNSHLMNFKQEELLTPEEWLNQLS